MKVEITKNKYGLYDVRIEKHKCGKLCNSIEDIQNYIFKEHSSNLDGELKIYVSELLSDKEYHELLSRYKGG